jgi:hypothetical protein
VGFDHITYYSLVSEGVILADDVGWGFTLEKHLKSDSIRLKV